MQTMWETEGSEKGLRCLFGLSPIEVSRRVYKPVTPKIFGGEEVRRPKSIKEVEYEILKYIMTIGDSQYRGLSDLFMELGAVCNERGSLLKPTSEKVKDKPLQKRIITAKHNVKDVIGNMIDRRIKYLTEDHIDCGIKSWREWS